MLKLYMLLGFMSMGTMLCTNEIQNIDYEIQKSFNQNIVKAILSNDLDLAKSIIKCDHYANEDKDFLLNSRTNIAHLAAYFNIPNALEEFLENALNKKQVLDILKTIKKFNPGLICELGIKLGLVIDQDLDVKLEILNILKDFNPTAALFFALALLDCSIILELLDSDLNIDINVQNPLSLTVLMFALESPNDAINEEVIFRILDRDLDINIQDVNGTTAFMIALKNNNGRVTENILLRMLDFNPDINIKDINGTSALMIASRNKSGIVTDDIWLRFLALINIS